MYLPAHFAEGRPEVLQRLVRDHPLATVVIAGAEGLVANALPLLWEAGGEHGVLRGHVARANPLWREVGEAGLPALAVFQGPQGYVTPSSYAAKAVDGRVVPTWNYAVVHAHGRLRAVDDAPWIHALVTRLTATHEQGRTAPWAVEDAPADYIERMVAAVVGIELVVERLEGKFKLSQNRPAGDRAAVAAAARAEGATDLADLMATQAADDG